MEKEKAKPEKAKMKIKIKGSPEKVVKAIKKLANPLDKGLSALGEK